MTRMSVCLAMVSCVGVLLAWIFQSWPDDFTHVIMCDVGQGDAVILSRGFTQVLIDGGPNTRVLSCLGEKLPFWDRQLELVVVTHAHKDHYEGLKSVLGAYTVSQLLIGESEKSSADFKQFEELVSSKLKKGLIKIPPQVGHKYVIDSSSLCMSLSPQVQIKEVGSVSSQLTETMLSDAEEEKSSKEINVNDESIALLCNFGDISVLLMGDLEQAGESALMRHGLISDIDILKVGHHGSKSSSTTSFLALTRPEIALISSGKNNQYGHPHSQTISHLEEIKASILRTDLEGTIEIVSDGVRYWRE